MKTIGILGTGQLSRMLMQAALNYPINVIATDNPLINCDFLTIEVENIDISQITIPIIPPKHIIELICDRLTQKQFLIDNCIPTATLTTKFPAMCKLRHGGYDGRGTKYVSSIQEVFEQSYILEEFIDFREEIGIIVVRSRDGIIRTYDPVKIITKDHQLDYTLPTVCPEATQIAITIVSKLKYIGVMGIEFFRKQDGTIIVNELAPRVHNSGHHTQDQYNYSQFDLHIRTILDIPLPELRKKYEYGSCINIIGQFPMMPTIQLTKTEIYLHDYNKTPVLAKRKMGHYNVMSNNIIDFYEIIHKLKENIRISAPQVAIIMGSASDYEIMKMAEIPLNNANIPYEVEIISAHRTPNKMYDYANSAVKRGIKIIIAGAGGAAHLPGMVASMTSLPVIGVPVHSSNSILGIDSLLSIVQMPNGTPVATMAINGAHNAAIFAIKVLVQIAQVSHSIIVP